MSPLTWRLLATALISVTSLSGLSIIYFGVRGRQALVGALVALAAGPLLAAAFLAGPGPIVSFVVLPHEVPQEIGDLAVLVHAGLGVRVAALLNLSTALLAVVGAVIGYYALEEALSAIPYVYALSAGGFVYIAASDLIPGLHLGKGQRRACGAFGMFLPGLLLMGGVRWLAEELGYASL